MPDYDETKRRLIGRIGGLSLHLRHNSNAIARRARSGFDLRFFREAAEIDPTLEGEDLAKKVKLLRSLYFTRLRLKFLKTHEKKHRRADVYGRVMIIR